MLVNAVSGVNGAERYVEITCPRTEIANVQESFRLGLGDNGGAGSRFVGGEDAAQLGQRLRDVEGVAQFGIAPQQTPRTKIERVSDGVYSLALQVPQGRPVEKTFLLPWDAAEVVLRGARAVLGATDRLMTAVGEADRVVSANVHPRRAAFRSLEKALAIILEAEKTKYDTEEGELGAEQLLLWR